MPYLFSYEVQSNIQDLESIVRVETRDVGDLTMAALLCLGVMVLLAMALLIFI